MMRSSWVLVAAVAAAAWLGTATSRADDTMKLDLKAKDAVKTTNLLGDGGADTVEARWGWGGWGRGWGWGGARWGWGWRGWGWNAARWGWGGPGWGWAWGGRPWVGGAYYAYASPAYYAAPVYYYTPPVYYYSAPAVYAAPIGLTVRAPFVSLNIRRPAVAPAEAGSEVIPAPRPVKPAKPDGTFQYDGGPTVPVPMPQAEPAPNRTGPSTIVPDGRVVSRQSTAPKYSYSAYGEKPVSRPAADRQLAARPAK